MPLDSKWATSEPIVEEVASKKPARSAKKVSTPHRLDSKKKRGSKTAESQPALAVSSDTDEYTTDSDWSRPNSGRKSAIFDKGKSKESHGSSSLTENPLAKALGISLDPPTNREVQTKEPKNKQQHHQQHHHQQQQNHHQQQQQQQSKNSQHSKASQESTNKAKKPNEKKSQALKKRIEEQKKLLEENKRKAEQKELINSLLDGDISFDWEDDETELMEKLKIQED